MIYPLLYQYLYNAVHWGIGSEERTWRSRSPRRLEEIRFHKDQSDTQCGVVILNRLSGHSYVRSAPMQLWSMAVSPAETILLPQSRSVKISRRPDSTRGMNFWYHALNSGEDMP